MWMLQGPLITYHDVPIFILILCQRLILCQNREVFTNIRSVYIVPGSFFKSHCILFTFVVGCPYPQYLETMCRFYQVQQFKQYTLRELSFIFYVLRTTLFRIRFTRLFMKYQELPFLSSNVNSSCEGTQQHDGSSNIQNGTNQRVEIFVHDGNRGKMSKSFDFESSRL